MSSPYSKEFIRERLDMLGELQGPSWGQETAAGDGLFFENKDPKTADFWETADRIDADVFAQKDTFGDEEGEDHKSIEARKLAELTQLRRKYETAFEAKKKEKKSPRASVRKERGSATKKQTATKKK
jgi:hypothetical protein